MKFNVIYLHSRYNFTTQCQGFLIDLTIFIILHIFFFIILTCSICIRYGTGLWFIRNMFKVIEFEVRISNSLTRLKDTVRANPRASVSAVSNLLSCLETFLRFACCWQRLTVDLSTSNVFIPLLLRAAKYFSQRIPLLGLQV